MVLVRKRELKLGRRLIVRKGKGRREFVFFWGGGGGLEEETKFKEKLIVYC